MATTPLSASAQPSTGGFIQADPATNSLVITAAEPLYRQIRSVIDQLDGRRAQVFVESMIVEMDASKAAELGFQWQGLLGKSGDRFGLAAGTNFGGGANNILNLSVAGATGTATTLPGTGLNLGLLQKVNGVYTLGALARFLETVSGTNILSTPNLVALDNEEAKIVVGAERALRHRQLHQHRQRQRHRQPVPDGRAQGRGPDAEDQAADRRRRRGAHDGVPGEQQRGRRHR